MMIYDLKVETLQMHWVMEIQEKLLGYMWILMIKCRSMNY